MASLSALNPFQVVPGVGIGPFLLGMTTEEINAACERVGLTNGGTFQCGLSVQFSQGRAVRIEVAADLPLELAGEPLTDRSNQNIQRLLDKILPIARDWTEREGLVVLHWELSDASVFSFLVYSAGYRNVLDSDST